MGFQRAGVSSRILLAGCDAVRRSMSRRYSTGLFLCHRDDAIRLDRTAAALPPRSLWYRSWFFLLGRAAPNRKNWLFAGNDEAGDGAALLYSLLASCRQAGVEPYTIYKGLVGANLDAPGLGGC